MDILRLSGQVCREGEGGTFRLRPKDQLGSFKPVTDLGSADDRPADFEDITQVMRREDETTDDVHFTARTLLIKKSHQKASRILKYLPVTYPTFIERLSTGEFDVSPPSQNIHGVVRICLQ